MADTKARNFCFFSQLADRLRLEGKDIVARNFHTDMFFTCTVFGDFDIHRYLVICLGCYRFVVVCHGFYQIAFCQTFGPG